LNSAASLSGVYNQTELTQAIYATDNSTLNRLAHPRPADREPRFTIDTPSFESVKGETE
jgi:hypothetical protein